jgi:hypothetical protein
MSTVRTDNFGPSAGGTTYSARGIAKAWVNFNGTGTIAARDSENVSSLTDNGTGDYTVNFSNAFGAGDYAMLAACSYRSGNYNAAHIFTTAAGAISAPTTTAARLQLSTVTLGSGDSEYVTVAIHGDLA